MHEQAGMLTSWDDVRGYGFITPHSSGPALFMHIHDFSRHHQRPSQGLAVWYIASTDDRGRACAVQVRPQKGHRKWSPGQREKGRTLIALGLFALLLTALLALDRRFVWVLLWYGGASLLTFACYVRDKQAARRGGWRTPESSLLLASMVGGWPGALLGQQFLRHKTQKPSFLWRHRLVLVVHGVCVLALLVIAQQDLGVFPF